MLFFKELYEEYSKIHDKYNESGISKISWSYSCYESGEKIKDSLRAKYRNNYDVMFSTENPFALSNNHFEKILTKRKWFRKIGDNSKIVMDSIKKDGIQKTMLKIIRYLRKI